MEGGRERSRSNIETYKSPGMNQTVASKSNVKKQISIDVEDADGRVAGYPQQRARSRTTKQPGAHAEDEEPMSMNEVVTSRNDDDEIIEDDVTTNRDGLGTTFDDREGYKSVERIKG